MARNLQSTATSKSVPVSKYCHLLATELCSLIFKIGSLSVRAFYMLLCLGLHGLSLLRVG